MTTRTQLRDTVAGAIDAASGDLMVYTGSTLGMAVDVMPAAYVQIATGGYEHDLSGDVAQNRVDMSITYMHKGTDHDRLDEYADVGNAALFADAGFRSVVQAATLTGYTYEDDAESGLTAIVFDLSVTHA